MEQKLSLSRLKSSSVGGSSGQFIPKHSLKYKTGTDGFIMSIHNSVLESAGDGQQLTARVKLELGCFNGHGQYVVIDRNGNVFVIDFASKLYWKLPFDLHRTSCLKASIWKQGQYFVGNKIGELVEFDTEQCAVLKKQQICSQRIDSITFLHKEDAKIRTALMQAGREAILFDLVEFVATHRLDFEAVHITLKYASCIPHSELIFTCFTDDSLQFWSATTLETVKALNLTKHREDKMATNYTVKDLYYKVSNKENGADMLLFPDYTDGNILSYCFSADGISMYMCTSDCYLMILNTQTFELLQIFRLRDFALKNCKILFCGKDQYLLGLTFNGKVLLIDVHHLELRLLFDLNEEIIDLGISEDSKLLYVLTSQGKAQIWSVTVMYNKITAQRQTMDMLRAAMKDDQKTPTGMTTNQLLNSNLKKLLTKSKIGELLRENNRFPAKFRLLIWCSLLNIPGNRMKFQELLQLPIPEVIRKNKDLKIKDENLSKIFIQVWSCLSHWCKVLAHSTFFPELIFPFVKYFSQHSFIVFEILVTLILNHFYLWFEFHPLDPANYIGIIENIMQHEDASLCRFFLSKKVESKIYCWSMLANGFSEVLDEEQWAQLWDHIIFGPPYFPIFCVVAYNILQKETIIRLPDKRAILYFYQEQNPIDMKKLIDKAYRLMVTCPDHLNPSLFIKSFQALPKGVYPMFLNFPKEKLDEQESRIAEVKLEQKSIDARIRQLEWEEVNMMLKLKDDLKEEEQLKRIKEMDRAYQEAVRREEERVATQRKLLVLYQKEIRQKKQQIIAEVEQSNRRKNVATAEYELENLRREIELQRLRHESDLLIIEEDLKNKEIEKEASKFGKQIQELPFSVKYKEDLNRLSAERIGMQQTLSKIMNQNMPEIGTASTNLDRIEESLNEIFKEFKMLKSS